MDNMNGVYTEALAQLKALSSQITTMPASEIIQKVDQIVGWYQKAPFFLSDHPGYSTVALLLIVKTNFGGCRCKVDPRNPIFIEEP